MLKTIIRLAGFWAMISASTAYAEDLVLLDTKTASEFQMFLGDAGNWRQAVRENSDTSAQGRVSVTPSDQYGGLALSWKGRGEGQFYLASSSPEDLTEHLENGSAMAFLIKVTKPPKRQTVLRMGCGYPCAGNADITKVLKALPKDEWLRLTVDLQCFASEGLDATRVDTPFLLLTEGKLALEIADIRLVPGLREKAAIRC